MKKILEKVNETKTWFFEKSQKKTKKKIPKTDQSNKKYCYLRIRGWEFPSWLSS